MPKVARKSAKVVESPSVVSGPDSFSDILKGHFLNGTHPSSMRVTPDFRWKPEAFAEATRTDHGNAGVSAVTVRSYLRGDSEPVDIRMITSVLFADDIEHQNAKHELERAWLAAKDKRQKQTRQLRRSAHTIRALSPGTRIIEPNRCFGRQEDVSYIVSLLISNRHTALLGPGGIGKTTLATKAATHPEVLAHFGSHRWFVQLSQAATAAELEAEIVKSLGFDPAETYLRYALDRLETKIRRLPGLLLLDNFETPWNEDRRATREVLRAISELKNLVLLSTLRGTEEPDLPLWSTCVVRGLAEDASRETFLSYAGSLRQDGLLDTFLSVTSGLPLLIRLLALRARNHPNLRELWQEWQRLGIEVAFDPDAPEARHVSLDDSIMFSWRSSRLQENSKRLFCWLGQLPAGMSSEDRQELMGLEASDAAAQLTAFGLAEWREDGRLDLLPPVREVAKKRYQPQADDASRWWTYYLEFVRDNASLLQRRGGRSIATRLTLELANIEAALAAAVNCGQLRLVGEVAEGYGRMLQYTGRGSAAILQRAGEVCRASGFLVEAARSFIALGRAERFRTAIASARSDFETAIELARKASNKLVEADAILWLAELDRIYGTLPDARAGFQSALSIYEKISNELGEAWCLRGLAELTRVHGTPLDARLGLLSARSLFRKVGDDYGEGLCLVMLAELSRIQGDFGSARGELNDALSILQEVGSNSAVSHCLLGLGECDKLEGKWSDARDRFKLAREFFEQVGHDIGWGDCLLSMAEVDLIEGELNDARERLGEATRLYEPKDYDLGIAQCLVCLGRIDCREGNLLVGRENLLKGRALFDELEYATGVAACLVGLGEADLLEGNWADALANFRAAHSTYESSGHPLEAAEVLQKVAQACEKRAPLQITNCGV